MINEIKEIYINHPADERIKKIKEESMALSSLIQNKLIYQRKLEELLLKKKKYGFLKRIFKRKKYKILLETINSYNSQIGIYRVDEAKKARDIVTLYNEIGISRQQLAKSFDVSEDSIFRDDASVYFQKYQDILRTFSKSVSLDKIKNLNELDISFDEAYTTLRTHGVIPIICDDDFLMENDRKLETLDDIVLIYASETMPEECVLSSETIPAKTKKFSFGEIEIEQQKNNTTFSCNGIKWDKKNKYAVFIPAADVSMFNATTLNLTLNNITIPGKFRASRGYILCPKNEFHEVSRKNPNFRVVGYIGDNVNIAANQFVKMLGFRSEQITDTGWQDKKDEELIKRFFPFYNLATFDDTHNFPALKEESIFSKIISALIKSDYQVDFNASNDFINEISIIGKKGDYYAISRLFKATKDNIGKINISVENLFAKCAKDKATTYWPNLVAELDKVGIKGFSADNFSIDILNKALNTYILKMYAIFGLIKTKKPYQNKIF